MFWGGKPEHESSVTWLDPFIVRLGSKPVCNWRVLLRFFIPCNQFLWWNHPPGSKLLILGMVIPPLIGNLCNGYINPYYWIDDHPNFSGTKLTPTNQHLVPPPVFHQKNLKDPPPKKKTASLSKTATAFFMDSMVSMRFWGTTFLRWSIRKRWAELASKTTLLWTPS